MKRLILALAMMTPLLASPGLAQTYDNGTTTDQTGTHTDHNANTNVDNTNRDESLPGAASALPLLALGGLGSLAAGLWMSRRRRQR